MFSRFFFLFSTLFSCILVGGSFCGTLIVAGTRLGGCVPAPRIFLGKLLPISSAHPQLGIQVAITINVIPFRYDLVNRFSNVFFDAF
jgi:hypothetical protein